MKRAPRSKREQTSAALERAFRDTLRRTSALRAELELLRRDHVRLALALGTDRAWTLTCDEQWRWQRETALCAVCGHALDDHRDDHPAHEELMR